MIRLFKLVVFTASLLAGFQFVSAAPYARVHPLYLEEERQGDYTHASLRDKDGFLWIATDNGLKRYDGYNLRVFSPVAGDTASIGTNSIRHLLLQSNGALWAAGANLNRYHPETESFTTFHITDFQPIRAVSEDQQGMFWIGGEGFGLLRFDPGQGKVTQSFFNDSEKGHIWSIAHRGKSSRIWVASAGGLYSFHTDTQEIEEFSLPLDMGTTEPVRALAEDDSGRLWVATYNGLFRIDPASGELRHWLADEQDPNSLAANVLWTVMKDSQGTIWVGTDKKGVHRYNPSSDSFEHFPSSLHSNGQFPAGAVTHIHEDAERSLWFSMGYHGMYRLSEHLEKFRSFRSSVEDNNTLSFNNVLSMLEDRAGNIWIATDGGGLNRFDPDTHSFTRFRHNPEDPASISSDAVIALAEDSKGYIWVGTWAGGLNRLDPATGEFQHIRRDPDNADGQSLADDNIFRIVIDDQDRLLLSVWAKGLQIFDPATNTFKLYSPHRDVHNSGIRSESINDIVRAPDGEYWIAGYKGLEIFSPATGKFTPPAFPITEAISDLHLDHASNLWIATNKGLIRYTPASNVARHFSVEDGLSHEYVLATVQDRYGYLWLPTRNGLNRLDPRTNEFTVYDELDGLSGSQFNRFSHLKTRNGTLYFGGTKGFSYFDPGDLPRNEHAPEIHITSLEVNQKPVKPGSVPWLKRAVNYTDRLVLPYSHRDIAFNFTATSFIAPTKNRFRYRLKGLEEEWYTVDSTRRRVRYNNIEPGHYQFQLLAANNEGVWAGSARTLDIVILPAWWQTWWARGLYLVLLLIAMSAFSNWRLRFNRRRQKLLETQVEEQTSRLKQANRSIVQLNSELEQRVAHRTQELSQEIEERRESEAKANFIAYHDSLTGLHNRAWLLKHLDHLIKSRSHADQNFALIFVGGDRFRKINDTYGHLFGDQLLVEASKRLAGLLDKGADAARLGSDEFTVIINQLDSEAQATILAERITAAFKEPFTIQQVRIVLSVSVGYVICSNTYTESAQVLRNANIAMQRAKDRGRGVCQMFDEEILQHTLDTAALEADLKLALGKNQFSVVYQPIIVMETGHLHGFELLIRWRHPERGMVPPDKFIAMAESLGLIFDIGIWVLRQACEQLVTWQQQLPLPIPPTIAVNLSPVQLEHVELLECIDQVFAETGADREFIKFEITESALMKSTEIVDGMLGALRERGIELAIDDFGTGYSSLSYLDKLPVQVLKIDRTFVNGLTDVNNKSGSAHEIVRATISLAHNLRMHVVAEGIETDDQYAALKAYACDFGQGYHIARPMTPEDATDYLRNATMNSDG